jgi:hypothetical protein
MTPVMFVTYAALVHDLKQHAPSLAPSTTTSR